ncbi:MAG: TadE family type IV pilus minor pilin [Gordonia sp. (in: high G+C Gram-positive bacteria)]|uniref:TadE family type IV pilus minor pilin n=1 Tax=Gordonia sp. (in: high G+C Gram-positive bacteria) TaxID=84139 RepID=UPI0039E4EE60
MATVEAAYALAALAAFVVLCVGVIGGITAHLRCTDAAREVARLAAAGDTSAAAVGARVAPHGARIEVHQEGDHVVARVVARLPLVPLLDVSARSVAAKEPDYGAAEDG